MPAARLDSLELERGGCHSGCRAYAVRITRGGHVIFSPEEPGGPLADTTLDSARVAPLFALATRNEIGALFADGGTVVDFCPVRGSDRRPDIVRLYRSDRANTIIDTGGCRWRAPDLVEWLEVAIDTVANTKRWLPFLDPIYVIDGRMLTSKEVDSRVLDPCEVDTLNVVKPPEAVRRFGVRARRGAIVMIMKRAKPTPTGSDPKPPASDASGCIPAGGSWRLGVPDDSSPSRSTEPIDARTALRVTASR